MIVTSIFFLIHQLENVDNTTPSQNCSPHNTSTPLCPGDTVDCYCTVIDNTSGTGHTQWNLTALGISLCNESHNIISLSRRLPLCINQSVLCGDYFYAKNENDSCQTSKLTIKVNLQLNRFQVICHDTKSQQDSMPYQINITG